MAIFISSSEWEYRKRVTLNDLEKDQHRIVNIIFDVMLPNKQRYSNHSLNEAKEKESAEDDLKYDNWQIRLAEITDSARGEKIHKCMIREHTFMSMSNHSNDLLGSYSRQ